MKRFLGRLDDQPMPEGEKRPEKGKAGTQEKRERRPRIVPTVSARLDSGEVVELVYKPRERQTRFLVWKDGDVREKRRLRHLDDRLLVPFSPENNLLSRGVVLFPEEASGYESESALIEEVRGFIHRYVDLSELFEEISTYYVLFTWIYDDFNELAYLRVRGDYGTGKSRFLLTVGSLCYKPIFAGTATVSPLFRILDSVRGTLVIDEGDFRLSDEKAEIIKILNNGNARGFPVLRSEQDPRTKEFNPRAFEVFGPKLIATRGYFEDRALESRTITEELRGGPVRADIPLNLPHCFHKEARMLRDKLLVYRFRKLGRTRDLAAVVDRTLEPRLNQVFAPLASTIAASETRERLRELARRAGEELSSERSLAVEAQVLEVVKTLRDAGEPLALQTIARRFQAEHGAEYQRPITPRWIGFVLRQKLGLSPRKSHGTFIVPLADDPALARLFDRYGLNE